MTDSTIHASAALVGAKAVLILGPSGSGKSRLVLALLDAAQAGVLTFARLVGDDRVHLETAGGRLLVRRAPALAGLLEVRGLGIRRLPCEPVAVVGLVVELDGPAERLPERLDTVIEGVTLPRLTVASGIDPFALVLAALRTEAVPSD